MNLLRICACATAIINTIHLPAVFACPEQGDMQEETTTNYCKTSLDEATRHLCVCYNNYNHLQTVFVQNRVICKEKQQQ